MATDLIERARSGDEAAFAQLVEPYRRELQVHCYRMLGSLADAEDAVQETMLSAWRGLRGFEERSSMRTWLYRIATTRALNALRAAKRRPAPAPALDVEPPPPTHVGEVVWLEPYPDMLLDDLPDPEGGPDARVERREAISLAFVTALQLLPPSQRAALILCDVLDFPAQEAAAILETTQQAVSSALKRARTNLARELPEADDPLPAHSPEEAALLERFVRALESSDVEGMVALMTEDAWLRMPPLPFEYQGRELAGRFLAAVAFREGRRFRLVPTRANGQPAFGVYLRDPLTSLSHAFGMFVLTLAGDRISAITRFDNSVVDRFGLPRTLAD